MKKYLLSLAVMFLLCINVVFAQKTAEQRAERQTKNLTKKLGLNADQNKKVYDINLAIDKQIDIVKQGEKGKKGGYGGKLVQLQKDRESQITAVFTPEQKAKYDQWMTERKTKRDNKKGKKMKDDDDND
jgi:hypothetical protein